ncbi:hypothetical protein EYR36_000016 [Pleurotus pulmonarius]|nr:hypothetical protein EYR36_000016 [Pleurotus pulmonarius]KAF4584625.1 hypothetical protein EYR38_001854 [Pleurotus pulmonarius]KAF4584633.1 hypothetical protein EYR38_001862 [Pleurotus pulmonarius]KAF4604444.1 hypothetical protein EYR38_004867 [Pleurotus pulmonarius]
MSASVTAGFCYQKAAFVQSILPYYLQSKENKQEAKFLKAAHRLLADRFPILREGVTPHAFGSATRRAQRTFDKRLQMAALFHGRHTPAYWDQLWKDYMTVSADRQRRRQEWLTMGGVPRHHQYMVAFL